MAKINVTPAAREITEHFAAGGNVRAFQRAMIAKHSLAFFIRMGGVPRYDDAGAPVNAAAVKATVARKARLEARAVADKARRDAAKAARIAEAEKLAAKYALAPATTDELDSYLATLDLDESGMEKAREELSN